MYLYSSLILFLLFASTFTLDGYLDSRHVFLGPDKKVIHLLADDHRIKQPINKEQFDAMMYVLQEAEKLSDTKLMVLIEYPLFNYIAYRNATIQCPMYGLFHYTNDLRLRSVIQDCDIRKVANTVRLLLESNPQSIEELCYSGIFDPGYDGPYKQFTIDCVRNLGCRIDRLTFQDLLDNHSEWRKQCKIYRDAWNSKRIRKAFDDHLITNEGEYDKFIESLNSACIDLNMKVCDYAYHFWKTNGYANTHLVNRITNAFSDFLDMYLLNKILELQRDPSFSTIVICAGRSHTSEISRALTNMGYKELVEPIREDCFNNIISRENILQILTPLQELEGAQASPCILM